MKFLTCAVSSLALCVAALPAHAAEIIVNDVSGFPSQTLWGTLPGENTGTAAVTTSAPRSGNGSLELTGDRTRTQLGIQYGYPNSNTTIASLSDVNSLTFDWNIAGNSVTGLNADYTPALRLLIQDGATRKELIWEGAYNGTYGNTMRDTWYTSSASDLFYITGGSVNEGKTISAWASDITGATVSGISVGAGSSAGASYRAFVDNVTLNTTSGSTVYNFETTSVPEPATWAMLIIGFGLTGVSMRRRKSRLGRGLIMSKSYADASEFDHGKEG